MRRYVVQLPVLLALGACYRYVPIATSEPAVGTEVRSYLTPEGKSSLAGTLGRDVASIDGRLIADQSNVWRMAVAGTSTSDARRVTWTGEPVDIPKSAVERFQMRVLDRPRTIRTAILAAIGGVAVGLAIRGIATSDGGSFGPGGPPNP